MEKETKTNRAETKPAWLTQDYIRENNYLLFEVKVGSQAYGTATPASDVDLKGVFLMPDNAAHSIFFDESWETLKWNNGKTGSDKVESEWVSLRKFLRELMNCNPGRLEMIYSPDDCVVFKHPAFDYILHGKQTFLTRKCEKAFAEYAMQQIRKARGQNKKQNWSKERKERQSLLSFCYTFAGQGSVAVVDRLAELGSDIMEVQAKCGMIKVPHMRDVYSVFYDHTGKLGYKGILSKDKNNVALSSIPKGEHPLFHMQFNTDAWALHCKEYREYKEWDEVKNDDRWVDVQSHGQKIDGKNMLHCVRLIDVSTEIALYGEVRVRRSPENIAHLLDIKKGRVSLDAIIEESEAKLKDLPNIYANSSLPEIVDPILVDVMYWKSRHCMLNTTG